MIRGHVFSELPENLPVAEGKSEEEKQKSFVGQY
jgi:hypothetical protein